LQETQKEKLLNIFTVPNKHTE